MTRVSTLRVEQSNQTLGTHQPHNTPAPGGVLLMPRSVTNLASINSQWHVRQPANRLGRHGKGAPTIPRFS